MGVKGIRASSDTEDNVSLRIIPPDLTPSLVQLLCRFQLLSFLPLL